jgi:N-methylhydantoinase A
MPPPPSEQTDGDLRIGVDVGGTFTDLVCFDPATSELCVVKLPSTPPDFDCAVVEAVARAADGRGRMARVVHGSTVATNALLQRAGEPVAFVTTDGFRDMMLIGRQNRPRLYALHIVRPQPLTREENWFTVRERIGANGEVVESLDEGDVDRLIDQIASRGLRHVAVCLLFSFANPAHEQLIGRKCAAAGMTVSLSSDVLPEFREYERASTTVINASLRPTVQTYLTSLHAGLPAAVADLRIMHSAGGTLTVDDAQRSAARLVLSGPAGGVMGALLAATSAGFPDVITYDMGGTSTDVATIVAGRPQWTTSSTVDGLPVGLPAFDIHTVGAGGGSVAYLDRGGALHVGPRSAGAMPGPACYNRGGTEPTVTDANLVLGRIVPDAFAGGTMRVDPDLARRAIEPLAERIGKSVIDTALGIIRIAENNMGHAIRAVTSRRGLDPRRFTLVSFGGAGGLHACALADSLEIPRVLVPPYCGVLSALGMVAAPPVVDLSRTVVHLSRQLDDARLAAEYAQLTVAAAGVIPNGQTEITETYADVRFRGQSYEVKVRVEEVNLAEVVRRFRDAYAAIYGHTPSGREVEVVTLRVRRVGRHPTWKLPRVRAVRRPARRRQAELVDQAGAVRSVPVLERADLVGEATPGPVLVIDPEATTYVAAAWSATGQDDGGVVLTRTSTPSPGTPGEGRGEGLLRLTPDH